jgi:hypothetical protein
MINYQLNWLYNLKPVEEYRRSEPKPKPKPTKKWCEDTGEWVPVVVQRYIEFDEEGPRA